MEQQPARELLEMVRKLGASCSRNAAEFTMTSARVCALVSALFLLSVRIDGQSRSMPPNSFIIYSTVEIIGEGTQYWKIDSSGVWVVRNTAGEIAKYYAVGFARTVIKSIEGTVVSSGNGYFIFIPNVGEKSDWLQIRHGGGGEFVALAQMQDVNKPDPFAKNKSTPNKSMPYNETVARSSAMQENQQTRNPNTLSATNRATKVTGSAQTYDRLGRPVYVIAGKFRIKQDAFANAMKLDGEGLASVVEGSDAYGYTLVVGPYKSEVQVIAARKALGTPNAPVVSTTTPLGPQVRVSERSAALMKAISGERAATAEAAPVSTQPGTNDYRHAPAAQGGNAPSPVSQGPSPHYSGNKRPDSECEKYLPSPLDLALTCELAPNGSGPTAVTFSMKNSSGCRVAVRATGKVTGSSGSIYITGTAGQPDTLWGRTNGFSDDDTRTPFRQVLPPNVQEHPASCEIYDIEACSATAPREFPQTAEFRPFFDGRCTKLRNVGPIETAEGGSCTAVVTSSSPISMARIRLGLGSRASSEAGAIEAAKSQIGSNLQTATGSWCKGQCYVFQAPDGLRYANLAYQRCGVPHGALAVIDGVEPPGDFYWYAVGEGNSAEEAAQDAMNKCTETSNHKNLSCRIEKSW